MNIVAPSRMRQWRAVDWVCLQCRLRRLALPSRRFATAHRRLADQQFTLNTVDDARGRASASLSDVLSQSSLDKTVPKRKAKLPNGPARTRFAPSPTGYLHIGGLRTALFSYLLAKRTGGQFILRIEDTDQKRLVKGAEAGLCSDLQWAGLEWDEGPDVGGQYGPYRQSERNDIYRSHARRLLDSNAAYRCFCTPQAADGGRSTAYVTSGCYQNCSSISSDEAHRRADSGGEPFTVRLKQPLHAHKRTYPDLVYGNIQRLKRSAATAHATTSSEDGSDTDGFAADTILLKSDGTPTYHFANVIDDHLMKITHVIRGVEWMASTPLHYDIYSAFGWMPPQFAHVGLLVDEDQAKLSKRNSDLALDVGSMRDTRGVLPYTLNNFLALLGWSNPTSNDVMDMDMLVSNFDLKFTRGNTMVKMEKLWYLQRKQVAARCTLAERTNDIAPIGDIVEQAAAEVRKVYEHPLANESRRFEISGGKQGDDIATYCADILLADRKNYTDARQWVERSRYFFEWDPKQVPEEPAMCLDQTGRNGVHPRMLQRFAKDLDEKIVWDSGTADKYEALEQRIHVQLQESIRLATLTDFPIITSGDQYSVPTSTSLPMSEETATAWSDSTSPGTVEAFIKDVVKIDGEGAVALRAAIGWRFKVLNTIIMKYLRQRLTYGLPGPSLSWTMALLGEHECRKRLGSSS